MSWLIVSEQFQAHIRRYVISVLLNLFYTWEQNVIDREISAISVVFKTVHVIFI